MKRLSFLLFGFAGLMSCDQFGSGADRRLTCLFDGYDSCVYYLGPSSAMRGISRGKITDTPFVLAMFDKIKFGQLSLILKPGGGGSCVGNLKEVKDWAIRDGIANGKVDSTDANEEKRFGISTAPPLRAIMRGEEPFHLELPREPGHYDPGPDSAAMASGLVLLLAGDSVIYGYSGGNIRNGKMYTYPQLTELLKGKRTDTGFMVIIKPAGSASYKNTVDMLDEMKITDTKRYALVDITKEEEDYLHARGY